MTSLIVVLNVSAETGFIRKADIPVSLAFFSSNRELCPVQIIIGISLRIAFIFSANSAGYRSTGIFRHPPLPVKSLAVKHQISIFLPSRYSLFFLLR